MFRNKDEVCDFFFFKFRLEIIISYENRKLYEQTDHFGSFCQAREALMATFTFCIRKLIDVFQLSLEWKGAQRLVNIITKNLFETHTFVSSFFTKNFPVGLFCRENALLWKAYTGKSFKKM